MKLLITTQIVDQNDPALGFFHRWIEVFAKEVDFITVIALKVGAYDLPQNVRVLTLGKRVEKQNSILKILYKIKYFYLFYKYIILEHKKYDSVFIHMNQIYAILGFPIFRILQKNVGLWYAHAKVPLSLRIAEKTVDFAFASTEQGFRIKTKKLHLVGQGIDIDAYNTNSNQDQTDTASEAKLYKIISIGRISRSKNLHIIISAFKNFNKSFYDKTGRNSELYIVGGTVTEDDILYEAEIKKLASQLDIQEKVFFVGPVTFSNIPSTLRDKQLFVNMSDTGSLDKAILEAWASCVPVISSNNAFRKLCADPKYHTDNSVNNLGSCMLEIATLSPNNDAKNFRSIVENDHSLKALIKKILSVYKEN